MAQLNSQVHERVVQFGPARGMVGILTQPTSKRADDMPQVILLNSGIIHRVGSNRLYVELARVLAARGVTTLRFDFSGIGDSERRTDVESVREAVHRDVGDAIAYMAAEHDASRVVLFGLCSGAFDAFMSALNHDQVVGAFMVDMPGPFRSWRHRIHHIGVRLLGTGGKNIFAKLVGRSTAIVQRLANGRRADRAPSDGYVLGARGGMLRQRMSEQLDTLLSRNVHLYFAFTAGLEVNYNHASQFRSAFPRAASHPAISHAFFPDRDHAFGSQSERASLIALVEQWIRTTWAPTSDATRDLRLA